MAKKYLKVRGRWHSTTASEQTVGNRHPAVKLDCSGALVPLGFPESTRRPKELCEDCRTRPGLVEAKIAALDVV